MKSLYDERHYLQIQQRVCILIIAGLAGVLIIDNESLTFAAMVAVIGIFAFMLVGVRDDLEVLNRRDEWRRFRNVPEGRSQSPRRKMQGK